MPKKEIQKEIKELQKVLSESYDPNDLDSILDDFKSKIKYILVQMHGITPNNKYEAVKKDCIKLSDTLKRYISTH